MVIDEVDLKYEDGDILESSLVFFRSKDGRAGWWAATFNICNKTF